MASGERLTVVRRGDDESIPVVVTAEPGDGAWTPGPCAQIEAGNVIELDVDELAWLVEDAGPKVLTALRALTKEEEPDGGHHEQPA